MERMKIGPEMIARWKQTCENDPVYRVARRALSKTEINSAAFDAQAAGALRYHFSLEIPTLPVTNQKASGRCWLFAAANVLRERIAKKLDLENFELSQSYLAFWDKFERANYFMESVIDTADRPHDDRTVAFILQTGVHDGGQWDMFANIVRKYGVVPKDAFDETFQSSNSRQMNYYLNRYLKICAVRLRKLCAEGASEEAVRSARTEMMGRVYGFLCSCYGVPPEKFDFEYEDRDKAYHIRRDMTPASFTAEYVGDCLESVVSVINAPTADKPYGKTYSIRYLGNVVGGKDVKHLNLEMSAFKAAVIRQLEDGKVVWFGSDVGHFGDRELGIWDDRSFDAALLTGLDLEISKEDGLDMLFSAMNHAMVITGVDLKDGSPLRWKIENSWGDEKGRKGYYVCSDSWFDRYVYQAALEREYLGSDAALADQEPIWLEPWDPMGTLAQ